MSRFRIIETPLAGLRVVERIPLGDDRGFLARMFCADELAAAGWRGPVAQSNLTLTRQPGTVRGLHFQHPPHAERKLIHCIRGAVWDVAIDVRAGSPTFLQWFAHELSAENNLAMLIPEGFAHGFQSLVADCELLYFHNSPHAPGSEGALNATDPRLGINWPLPISARSARDQGHGMLNSDFQGLHL